MASVGTWLSSVQSAILVQVDGSGQTDAELVPKTKKCNLCYVEINWIQPDDESPDEYRDMDSIWW